MPRQYITLLLKMSFSVLQGTVCFLISRLLNQNKLPTLILFNIYWISISISFSLLIGCIHVELWWQEMTDENYMQFLHIFFVNEAQNIFKSLAPFYRRNAERQGRKYFIWQARGGAGAATAAAAPRAAAQRLSKYILIDERNLKYV